MDVTVLDTSIKHYPVLLKEIINISQHVVHLLIALLVMGYTKNFSYKNTKVIAIDRD